MCNKCYMVAQGLAKRMNITLFPYQDEILRETHSSNMVLLGGRQIGKTMIMALKVLSFALVHPSTTTLIVSPSLRQSLHIMRYIHEYISKLGMNKFAMRVNKSEVEFINKSRIISLPSSPNTIRGYTCHVVVVDEANFIDEELIQEVLMPTLSTTKGYMWLISTPYRKDHIFYRLYTNNMDGWKVFTIPSSMNPLITPQFLEEQRSILGILYEQEYMCKYVEDEQGLIPYSMIEQIITNTTNTTSTKRHDEQSQSQSQILLIDVGGKSSKMGVLICHLDDNDKKLIVKESRELGGEYLANIDDLIDEFPHAFYVVDVSGLGGSIMEYITKRGIQRSYGITWTRDNKYKALISMMRAIQDKELLINKNGANELIEQLRHTIIKNGKITTNKEYDDLLYALLLYYAYNEQTKHSEAFIITL